MESPSNSQDRPHQTARERKAMRHETQPTYSGEGTDCAESGKKKHSVIGVRVLEALKRHGCDISSEAEIKKWLISPGGRKAPPKEFEHTIAQWTKSEPTLSKLRLLAEVTGRSMDQLTGGLDRLLGHSPTVPGVIVPDVLRMGKEWLSVFLAQCEELSCYVVSVEQGTVESWKNHRVPSDGTIEDRRALAERWAKAIPVCDASMRLRRQHSLPDIETVRHQTLFDLLDKRLEWTRKVPELGQELADCARSEAYNGIVEVIQTGRSVPYERYPAVHPEDKDSKRIRSLRVSFDSLPCPVGERGWIIYYHWGPPLEPEEIEKLLPPKGKQSLQPNRRQRRR